MRSPFRCSCYVAKENWLTTASAAMEGHASCAQLVIDKGATNAGENAKNAANNGHVVCLLLLSRNLGADLVRETATIVASRKNRAAELWLCYRRHPIVMGCVEAAAASGTVMALVLCSTWCEWDVSSSANSDDRGYHMMLNAFVATTYDTSTTESGAIRLQRILSPRIDAMWTQLERAPVPPARRAASGVYRAMVNCSRHGWLRNLRLLRRRLLAVLPKPSDVEMITETYTAVLIMGAISSRLEVMSLAKKWGAGAFDRALCQSASVASVAVLERLKAWGANDYETALCCCVENVLQPEENGTTPLRNAKLLLTWGVPEWSKLQAIERAKLCGFTKAVKLIAASLAESTE